MGDDGILICPSFPGSGVATYHKESYFKPINVMYTAIFNAIGFPATVIPIGLSQLNEPGLPMSIQVIKFFEIRKNSWNLVSMNLEDIYFILLPVLGCLVSNE